MPDGYILVVEDDPNIRELVTQVIVDAGYRVLGVADGIEALRALDDTPPTLVLLDLQLPRVDGRRIAHEMRQRGIDAPMLVMSALPDIWQTASEIGAAGYCPKPFDIDDLIRAIDTLMPPATIKSEQINVWA